jgi:hypothetical protein
MGACRLRTSVKRVLKRNSLSSTSSKISSKSQGTEARSSLKEEDEKFLKERLVTVL